MSTSPNSSTSLIGIETEKNKEEKRKNPVQHYVKFSFVLTYILLLTTGTITFIEAIRTQIPAVRHIMNLETAISVIAGYFYSVFVTQIDKFDQDDKPIDWKDISKTRYVDWAITTPLMLLVLCSVLGLNTNVKVKGLTILSIVALNYMMLYTGYLGEVGQLGRLASMVIGFVPFIIMFSIIFTVFVLPKYVYANYALFTVFVSIWALYGVVYMLSEEYKNIAMNILECIAKCFVGIGLLMYYTKTIT